MPWTDCPGWLQDNFQASMVLVGGPTHLDLAGSGVCCPLVSTPKQKINGMGVSENWGYHKIIQNCQFWGDNDD
jgi:hypothetical protein